MMRTPLADQEMVKEALGDDFDELAQPPDIEVPREHPLWPQMQMALREIYDPEIPVNVYELGLIYKVIAKPRDNGETDIDVKMTLTSPACPVAQEMPAWVQGALLGIQGIGDVDVEIIWEPTWDPSKMAETAKLQLNMFM